MIDVNEMEVRSFWEFRNKVRTADLLSAAVQRLIECAKFTGKLSVIVENGRVLKSGYEESYFRQKLA